MQKLLFDLRLVMQQLIKSLGFSVTATLMLAFGIGATTAIFSIVEAVLLRPLPFPESDRVMVLADRLIGASIGAAGSYCWRRRACCCGALRRCAPSILAFVPIT